MKLELENKGVKQEEKPIMPYVRNNQIPIYCILRIGYKYKTVPTIKGFVKHMTREANTPNADPDRLKYNQQLYGAKDLYEDSKTYLKDCKIYKNSVVAREMLLTASPDFFKGLSSKDLELWKDGNVQWLQNTFRDNLRAIYLHNDESTIHLHALLIPRLWNDKKQCYTLQNYQYFNGIQSLKDMQDNYAAAMQKPFPILSRGIKGSRSHHIPVKHFYSNINKKLDTSNIEQVIAKAKNEDLVQTKNYFMNKTLKSFQHFNEKKQIEIDKLVAENTQLKRELEELKNKGYSIDKKETLERDRTQSTDIKRGFTGKRYNKSV